MRALRRGELLDSASRRELDGLDTRDRNWARELILGTVRLRGRIDHILAANARRPLESLDPDALDALRLGVYQLLEMDAVPAYAAVSESVELVKPAGRAVAGLTNAVLQAVRRSGGRTDWPDPDGDAEAWLSTWGSHPRWLVERWTRQLGVAGTRQLVEVNNSRASLYLRPVGMDADIARARLEASGIASQAIGFGALRLERASDVRSALATVPAIVQDPAAGAVVRYVEPPEGAVIADLCASPGGKTIGLAAGTGRASPRWVVAADASTGRIERLRENLARLPALPVVVVCADARRPPFTGVDVALLDAPCTGTGTFRRHVDGRWRVRPEDVATLAAQQAEMLQAAAGTVRPGGLLVYATCSIEPEENEDQIDAFLYRNPDYTLEPPCGIDAAMLDSAGQLRLLPHVHGFDGAFAARLRRRE
jgi:16S rRNA (cytosine967-C5)-methyltransferase